MRRLKGGNTIVIISLSFCICVLIQKPFWIEWLENNLFDRLFDIHKTETTLILKKSWHTKNSTIIDFKVPQEKLPGRPTY